MSSSRSSLTAKAAAAAMLMLLASCGFHLRGQATYRFDSIYINAPGSGAFAVELAHALESSGSAKVVTAPANAQVILDVTLVVDDKDVLSLSPGGRAREYALQKRVQIRLHDNAGADWLPQDEIVVYRTYLYDASERLARQLEENRLIKEMQTEAVQQVVRRLQTAKKPA